MQSRNNDHVSRVIVKNLPHPAPTADLSQFDVDALDKAVDLLKGYLFQHVQFLGKGVLLYHDPKTDVVYLSDADGNIGRLEFGELKQWAICRYCGAKGFLNGEEPAFVSAVMCVKCSGAKHNKNFVTGGDGW